jgi:phosphatidylserine decarboxylase
MIPLSRHGILEILFGTLALFTLGALLSWLFLPLGLLVLPFWIWLIAFFRDPNRPNHPDPSALLSPADGKVTDITPIDHHPLLGEPAVSVGIFLSVFNVHVNRAPCRMRILQIDFRPGKFLDARDTTRVSAENQSNNVLVENLDHGGRLVIRQLTGLIARRIIFPLKVGDELPRGARIGLIKFGSRTELIIPTSLNPKILVTPGQKVTGCITAIATLPTSQGPKV